MEPWAIFEKFIDFAVSLELVVAIWHIVMGIDCVVLS